MSFTINLLLKLKHTNIYKSFYSKLVNLSPSQICKIKVIQNQFYNSLNVCVWRGFR